MLAAISAWIVLSASPAQATEIVEVRVGRHPEFTRVVFELDRPAGYRVEKSGESGRQLTVRFDAASAPRKISARGGAIETVEVEPAGQAALARIGLRESGLRLKEMILANPPRIVLDVMHAPTAVAQKPATEEPAPPKPVAKQPATEQPAPPKPVAEQPVTPAPPKPVAKPVAEPVKAAQTTETPSDPDAVAKALGAALQAAAEGGSAQDASKPQAGAEGTASKPLAAKPAETPTVKPTAPMPAPAAKPIVTRAKPVPNTRTATEKPATPQQRPAATETADAEGPSPLLLGAGFGLLLCAVGLFFIVRRRGAKSNDDEDDDEIADSDAAPSFTDSVFGDSESAKAGEQSAAEAGSGSTDLDSFFDDDDDDAKADTETKGDEAMEQGISDLPADPDFGGMPPAPAAPAAGPDPDVLRVVHELERRMAQLEGKLGEANEARERLERQVAAQSEELRVQRAAIARTQRALRTLSRGEEEKATEPALRDDAQAKTRINV